MNIIFIIRRQKVLKNLVFKVRVYDCCENILKQTYLANCLRIEYYKFVNRKYFKKLVY